MCRRGSIGGKRSRIEEVAALHVIRAASARTRILSATKLVPDTNKFTADVKLTHNADRSVNCYAVAMFTAFTPALVAPDKLF